MSMNASIACVLFVGSKREGILCAILVSKEYGKLVGNHLQIWSGSFTREGGGGLGLLKLQLQVLKKRRVLMRKDGFVNLRRCFQNNFGATNWSCNPLA